MPFGEEVYAGSGGRTTAQGYVGNEGVRQQFTAKERDVETGLDYFGARYYASPQGRFISPDSISGGTHNPQMLNLYSYVGNNPLGFTDPTGHAAEDTTQQWGNPNAAIEHFQRSQLNDLFGIEPPSVKIEKVGSFAAPETEDEGQQNPCMEVNATLPANEGDGYYRYSAKYGSKLAADRGLMNYAQPGVISTMLDIAAAWSDLHPNHPIGIGDMGALGGGGDFNRHPGGGHAGGTIVDIRPMTKAGTLIGVPGILVFRDYNSGRVSYKQTSIYSRELTQELVDSLWATGKVENILFNDRNIRGVHPADKTHDVHLHIIFKSGIGCPQ